MIGIELLYLQKTIYNYKHRKKEKLFGILIYQIIIGNGLNILLWFNLNLIIILLFFAIAIFINNKYMTYIILIGIQIISFFFQIIIINFGIDIIVLFTFLLGQ